MEVRERAPLLREVRVRARHGENASDAKDPRTGKSPLQTAPHPGHRHHSPHPQTRQCLIPLHLSLSTFDRNLCLRRMFFHVFLLPGIKVALECFVQRLLQTAYTLFLVIVPVVKPYFYFKK